MDQRPMAQRPLSDDSSPSSNNLSDLPSMSPPRPLASDPEGEISQISPFEMGDDLGGLDHETIGNNDPLFENVYESSLLETDPVTQTESETIQDQEIDGNNNSRFVNGVESSLSETEPATQTVHASTQTDSEITGFRVDTDPTDTQTPHLEPSAFETLRRVLSWFPA